MGRKIFTALLALMVWANTSRAGSITDDIALATSGTVLLDCPTEVLASLGTRVQCIEVSTFVKQTQNIVDSTLGSRFFHPWRQIGKYLNVGVADDSDEYEVYLGEYPLKALNTVVVVKRRTTTNALDSKTPVASVVGTLGNKPAETAIALPSTEKPAVTNTIQTPVAGSQTQATLPGVEVTNSPLKTSIPTEPVVPLPASSEKVLDATTGTLTGAVVVEQIPEPVSIPLSAITPRTETARDSVTTRGTVVPQPPETAFVPQPAVLPLNPVQAASMSSTTPAQKTIPEEHVFVSLPEVLSVTVFNMQNEGDKYILETPNHSYAFELGQARLTSGSDTLSLLEAPVYYDGQVWFAARDIDKLGCQYLGLNASQSFALVQCQQQQLLVSFHDWEL